MNLLSPIKFGSLTLKNRVVLAPLTRGRTNDLGIPGPVNAEYYAQRSSAGLLITEASFISREGAGWNQAAAIYNEAQAAGWKIVTDAVHQAGGVIFCQLWHMGRQAHSSFNDGKQIVAPSVIAAGGETHALGGAKVPNEVPRPLETSEIPRLVSDYLIAAKHAKAAGFDGVEIHSANGYLLDTFLQSESNLRTDKYGGSVENRFRLHQEVIAAVSQVFPLDRIGIRFSPNGVYGGMGSADNVETFNYAISEVAKLGLGYIHLMDGLAFGFHNKCRQYRLIDARKRYDGLLIGNCGYTKDTAEGAIGTGAVDMIAFGRPFLSNPDLVERFTNNWPLAETASYDQWYGSKDKDNAIGYTDFPVYTKKE